MKIPRIVSFMGFVLSLFLLIVAVVLAGCARDAPSETDAADSVQEPVSVQVAEARRVTLRPALDLIGTIVAIPERSAVVSPQLGGWITKVDVVEGQSVHAKETLVELDSRSAQAALKRAQAVVAEKEAVLKRLKNGYLPQEVAGARQDAETAAAIAEGLRNELDALKDLLDRHEFSTVQYKIKAEALKAAESTLGSARQRVKLLEAGTRPESIVEAQASLDAVKADLEQMQLEVQWCTITSPIDGVVVRLTARQGQFIDRAVPLATIVDLSEVFVQLRVPGSAFGKVRNGTKVDVRLTASPSQVVHAIVARSSGQADPSTGNVIVFAQAKNEKHELRTGFSCHARVWLPEIPDALAIPVAAVADHAGTPVVTVIRDGKAFEVQVQLGAEADQLVEVQDGLSEGDRVATVGGYGLPDETPVTIVAAPPGS